MQSVVTIEKLVFGGTGLARTADGVMLVADALGGERVRIEPTGKRGGVVTARTVELLTPSPDRRAPPCPVAGVCGGCMPTIAAPGCGATSWPSGRITTGAGMALASGPA